MKLLKETTARCGFWWDCSRAPQLLLLRPAIVYPPLSFSPIPQRKSASKLQSTVALCSIAGTNAPLTLILTRIEFCGSGMNEKDESELHDDEVEEKTQCSIERGRWAPCGGRLVPILSRPFARSIDRRWATIKKKMQKIIERKRVHGTLKSCRRASTGWMDGWMD